MFGDFIRKYGSYSIIQAENPDGDSLGSALAIDEMIERPTTLYCPVNLPGYLKYFRGADRVTVDFDFSVEAYIIVDTAAEILLSKLLNEPAIANRLYSAPVLVIDHHETEDDLPFPHEKIIEVRPACSELIFEEAKKSDVKITTEGAEDIMGGIMSDTLGLTTSSVTARTFEIMAELTELGASVAEIEDRRRVLMKKSPRILDYKADLIKKIDYLLDGRLATVHIPFDEIQEYSNEYNPNVLILEEMRMVEGVEVAVAIKTYPDGKLTGKIRTESDFPFAEEIAASFGGGGHKFAAGFRVYDMSYEDVLRELVKVIVPKLEESEND